MFFLYVLVFNLDNMFQPINPLQTYGSLLLSILPPHDQFSFPPYLRSFLFLHLLSSPFASCHSISTHYSAFMIPLPTSILHSFIHPLFLQMIPLNIWAPQDLPQGLPQGSTTGFTDPLFFPMIPLLTSWPLNNLYSAPECYLIFLYSRREKKRPRCLLSNSLAHLTLLSEQEEDEKPTFYSFLPYFLRSFVFRIFRLDVATFYSALYYTLY